MTTRAKARTSPTKSRAPRAGASPVVSSAAASHRASHSKASFNKNVAALLQFAHGEARRSSNWIALHNAIFGIGGKFLELFPSQSERVAASRSAEFRQVAELIEGMQKAQKGGDDLSSAPPASGKFIVRIPPSLHTALLKEADAESVSLNQLCVAKLSAQLRAVV